MRGVRLTWSSHCKVFSIAEVLVSDVHPHTLQHPLHTITRSHPHTLTLAAAHLLCELVWDEGLSVLLGDDGVDCIADCTVISSIHRVNLQSHWSIHVT